MTHPTGAQLAACAQSHPASPRCLLQQEDWCLLQGQFDETLAAERLLRPAAPAEGAAGAAAAAAAAAS